MNNKIKKLCLGILFVISVFTLMACKDIKYTVVFNTDGGTEIKNVEVTEGEKVEKPTDPTKEGFKFDNWYKNEGKTEVFNFDTETINSETTIYAAWIALENYTVEFDEEKVTVVEGQKVEKPTNPKKEGYTFIGWFTDEECTTPFDFDTEINADIKLYSGWSKDIITAVLSVSNPTSYQTYLNNREEKVNKRTQFFDLEQKYMVGDDNNWNAKPIVTFIEYNTITGDFEEIEISEWSYEITIKELNETYVTIPEDSDLIDSVDLVNCLINFSEKAIGKEFQIEIVPTGLTANQQTNVANFTVRLEIIVTDGYNVYDGKELAYIDNRQDTNEFSDVNRTLALAWISFKEENNLNLNYTPTALIFHSDLDLTTDDVPEYFFYTESEVAGAADETRALGSMKDDVEFYFRKAQENSEFHIYGNYFTLNVESFKEVVRDNGDITAEGQAISHSSLFRFNGARTGVTSINNLNMFGNAPRVENVIKGGGLIFVKVEGPSFTAYNNIAAALFITYFPNVTFEPFIISKCKAYDGFNCFVYNHGSDKVSIIDCEMIGSGGPVLIQDHLGPTASDGGKIGKTVIENSVLESYVTGSEGWFSLVGAQVFAGTMKGLDALFNPLGKSFLKTSKDGSLKYLNFISINKSASAEGVTSEKIKGSVKIDEYEAFDFGETNAAIAAMLEATYSSSAPAFQTSQSTLAGGYGYTDGASGIFDLQNNQIVDPTNAIYQGDYLCIYYGGMAFILGYFPVGEVYSPSDAE